MVRNEKPRVEIFVPTSKKTEKKKTEWKPPSSDDDDDEPLTASRQKITVEHALRTHRKRLVPGNEYWSGVQNEFGYDEAKQGASTSTPVLPSRSS